MINDGGSDIGYISGSETNNSSEVDVEIRLTDDRDDSRARDNIYRKSIPFDLANAITRTRRASNARRREAGGEKLVDNPACREQILLHAQQSFERVCCVQQVLRNI